MKKLEEYQKKSITALLLEPGKYTFAVQSYNTEKADQTYTVEIKKVL